VHLRIGTGVACGFVFDGHPYHPQPKRTTHLEILQVMDGPDALSCPCGLIGCLETIACGATRRLDQAAEGIVTAVARLAQELGVDQIVLGGGVWAGSAALRERTLRDLADEKTRSRGLNVTVTCALLDDRAGAIGAAKIAIARAERSSLATSGP